LTAGGLRGRRGPIGDVSRIDGDDPAGSKLDVKEFAADDDNLAGTAVSEVDPLTGLKASSGLVAVIAGAAKM
jgi:hypothetical protein